MNEKEYLNVKDIQGILNLGKNKTYELIRQDDFPKIKIGKKYFIPRNEFETFMKRLLYKEYTF